MRGRIDLKDKENEALRECVSWVTYSFHILSLTLPATLRLMFVSGGCSAVKCYTKLNGDYTDSTNVLIARLIARALNKHFTVPFDLIDKKVVHKERKNKVSAYLVLLFARGLHPDVWTVQSLWEAMEDKKCPTKPQK